MYLFIIIANVEVGKLENSWIILSVTALCQ